MTWDWTQVSWIIGKHSTIGPYGVVFEINFYFFPS